ncbi:MAG: ParB N-terminal domain-containing protein, partial [Ilumatobacter sp.]|nr:ParB N-terminal domain-containing protein [Ilumatobacter sp.]
TGAWELTGRPSADVAEEHNRFPVVVRNRAGRSLVLSGHHRAAAALLAGRPLRARVVAAEHAYFVTPLLRVDPSAEETELAAVADCIRCGRPSSVPSLAMATLALHHLGAENVDIERAVRTAGVRVLAQAARPGS